MLCILSSVPSVCHRPNHLCDPVLEPHCSPLGISHHREPVINIHKIVLHIGLHGACGYPLPLFSGSLGNRGSMTCHCKSDNPLNLPLVMISLLEKRRSYTISNKIYSSGIGSSDPTVTKEIYELKFSYLSNWLNLTKTTKLTDVDRSKIDVSVIEDYKKIYSTKKNQFNATQWLKDHMHYFPNPSDVVPQMQECLNEIQKPSLHPIEQASRIWFDIVRIHISHEANKRTGKAMGSLVLLANGYLPPKITKEDEKKYVKTLENSFEKLGGLADFTNFVAGKVLDAQKEYHDLKIN